MDVNLRHMQQSDWDELISLGRVSITNNLRILEELGCIVRHRGKISIFPEKIAQYADMDITV